MELTLARLSGPQVSVSCDGQLSHSFNLWDIFPDSDKGLPSPVDNPITYGKALYQALFPPGTPAHRSISDSMPSRLLLVPSDEHLDAVPWEYIHGSKGFLAQECHFVRGLPIDKRIPPPVLQESLHILSVPSHPLSTEVEALDTDSEWERLKETLQQVPAALTVERVYTATIDQLHRLLVNRQQRIVHFMGHGGQQKDLGAYLCFEKDNGDLDRVSAERLALHVRGTTFLATMNACASATPGATEFSNLAATLVRQGIPYVLGMRLSIHDDDARTFSRIFYGTLARGASVEESLLKTRLALSGSPRSWVVGVPILYTALATPAAGFPNVTGTPVIRDHYPHIELHGLPHAEGVFQGRMKELRALGDYLTGDQRAHLITINGAGGQGKTALAREAVARFAFAWPGGIWGTSLENLPTREQFVNDLAHFLGLVSEEATPLKEMERRVLTRLEQHHTLIVLDNADTLHTTLRANDTRARQLAKFIRALLEGRSTSLLITSRTYLEWDGEVGCELEGLAPLEGVRLFRQHAANRVASLDNTLVWDLSQKVDGHPLSLRLLGSAFNTSTLSLAAFLAEYEARFLSIENKHIELDHRQRSLYASIQTSVQYLNKYQKKLLSRLWIFQTFFLPEIATKVCEPARVPIVLNQQQTPHLLKALWQRGLLSHEVITVEGRTLEFYRLLPITRMYIEQYMWKAQEREELCTRYWAAYFQYAKELENQLKQSSAAITIVQHMYEDLEQSAMYAPRKERGYHLMYCARMQTHLGNFMQARELLEQVLKNAQGERDLELHALVDLASVYQDLGEIEKSLGLNKQALAMRKAQSEQEREANILSKMANIYYKTGRMQEALSCATQALSLIQGGVDQVGEAILLDTIAGIYVKTGKIQEALLLCEKALSLMRRTGDRSGEASVLSNLASMYRATGRTREALSLLEQALLIEREMGRRSEEASVLNNIAVNHNSSGKPEQAIEYFERALHIHQMAGDREGEAAVLSNMAAVYQSMGNPTEAMDLYEQALPIQRAVHDITGEATTLSNMAILYQASGQMRKALSLYEEALLIQRKSKDLRAEAITLSNIVSLYFLMGQWEQALKLCEHALTISRTCEDKHLEVSVLNNMGLLYHALGKPQEALAIYQKILPIKRNIGDRSSEGVTLINIAGIYLETGQLEQGVRIGEQALTILREAGDQKGESSALSTLGELLQRMQRYVEAQALFEQAILLSRRTGHPADEASALVSLSLMLYRDLHRPAEAVQRIEQAIETLVKAGIPQSTTGFTLDLLRQYRDTMRQAI